MKRKASSSTGEEAEINVSPLIDMVFILLIFFIVATSFVNEVGISSNHKDTANSSTEISPLSFELPGSGQVTRNGTPIELRQIAPVVRTASAKSKPSVLVKISPGARAGLATQVMDQALLGGAKAVKFAPLPK
ncbi:MAG: biopolymer transporter ExbD [Opitutae bacterium]|jgi:biopolymer transport protein ExbD|nr:biopolymer transporter ExbD [Opitutae bacterium]